ncbi:DUF6236 family protein [Anaerocolumna sp.]|uniref:DUF6236 family protein n=1 Tax=Anaerocolumna sp. TaxID=2041569 RepID=UPI0028ACE45E|nr:DUF6236 family protein [Anaerocolumna sp.]
MKRRILYYPTINITDGIWLRNALLYWDEISSIMPYQNDDFEISPEIQNLMDTHYYVPTRPDDIMYSELYNEFIDEVKININEYNPRLHKSGNFSSVHRSKVESTFYHLHNSKISSDILPLLQEKSEILYSENRQWIYIEEELSNIYMAVLAKYLAAINHEDTVIGSDKQSNEDYIYKTKRATNKYSNRQPFLNYKCSVLPVPNMDTSIEEIIDFKRRRADELLHFRQLLTEFEEKLNKASDIVEVKSLCIEFEEKLAIKANDIQRVMKERRWGLKPILMNAMVGISLPGIINTLEMFGVPVNLTHKGIGIVAGTALSIYLTYREAGNIRKTELIDNPYSYLYYARMENILR